MNGIVGILNSSTATAYVHARCQPKPGFTELWTATLRGKQHRIMKSIPLPDRAECDARRHARERWAGVATTFDRLKDADALRSTLAQLEVADRQRYEQMISLQEELDWQVLVAYGFAPRGLVLADQAPGISVGQRAFEIALARRVAAGELQTMWFEKYRAEPTPELPTTWPAEYREAVAASDRADRVGPGRRPDRAARAQAPMEPSAVGRLGNARRSPRWCSTRSRTSELWSDLRPRSTAELTDCYGTRRCWSRRSSCSVESKDADLATTLRRLVLDAAVPHLAAQRFTDKGLRKRAVWERVWDLQRARIAGRRRSDLRSRRGTRKRISAGRSSGSTAASSTSPKERFVLDPNAERGADTSPVVGWAGWDERDLARALAGRIMELREQEAADAERVTPLLAGVLELLPWIHQWHPDSDPLYGGPPGQYFEGWLDGQLAELSITRDNLRAWRPPAPTRGRKAKAGAA